MAQLIRKALPACKQLLGAFHATASLNRSSRNNCNYDLVVVGGGIVGVAAAREVLSRHSNMKVAIVEKEENLAAHQTGHCNGVVHDGIYNEPNTLNARLCIEGSCMTYRYCRENCIPIKKCGKLIIATNEAEVARLTDLYSWGAENQIPDMMFIDKEQIYLIEPHCKGEKAIWCPHTCIVDWVEVTEHLAQDFLKRNGDIFLNSKITKFSETRDSEDACTYPVTLHGAEEGQMLRSRYVLTCGGLQADQLADLTGYLREPRIVPIRTEYLCLRDNACNMVRGIISSVPDLSLPYLGVNFIPQMDGSILVGPTALLAFQREGYKFCDINRSELRKTVEYPGFLKMVTRNCNFGLYEMLKSTFVSVHINAMQQYIPDIKSSHVQRGPTGVYASAIDKNGNVVNDFMFAYGADENTISERVLHCLNPPIPGATCSMAFAKIIADRVEAEFRFYADRSLISVRSYDQDGLAVQ